MNTVSFILRQSGEQRAAVRWLALDAIAPLAGAIVGTTVSISETRPRLPARRLRRLLPLHGRHRPAAGGAPARIGPPRRADGRRLHRDGGDRLRGVALSDVGAHERAHPQPSNRASGPGRPKAAASMACLGERIATMHERVLATPDAIDATSSTTARARDGRSTLPSRSSATSPTLAVAGSEQEVRLRVQLVDRVRGRARGSARRRCRPRRRTSRPDASCETDEYHEQLGHRISFTPTAATRTAKAYPSVRSRMSRCCRSTPAMTPTTRRHADSDVAPATSTSPCGGIGDRAGSRREQDRRQRGRPGAALVEARKPAIEQVHDHDPAADAEQRAEESESKPRRCRRASWCRPPPYSTQVDALSRLAAEPERAALFLDVDGVLAPIVDDPRTPSSPRRRARSCAGSRAASVWSPV